MRRVGRFRLRNWPLRYKHLVVILVPTLVVAILGYLRIGTELAKVDEFNRTLTQVELSATIEQVVHDVQRERDLVVGRVAAGKVDDRSAVAAQIDTVNRSITRLRATSITNLDQVVRTRYGKVIAGLGALDAIRQTAEQTRYPASDTQFVYDGVISSLLQLNREITRVSDDRTISEQASRIDALAGAKEQLAIQNSILRAAAVSGWFGPGQLARLRAAQAEFTAELSVFQDAADPAAITRYVNTVTGPEVDDRLRLLQNALNQGDAGVPITIGVTELDTAARATLDKMRRVERASLRDLQDTAQRLAATARTNAIRDLVVLGAALLVALLFMVGVTRSVLQPLRVLRRDALDVAHRRLPATINRILADPDPQEASKNAVEAVPVHTTEEVGQVARAFDALQEQAVTMATEHALLRDIINTILVNLSHRNQTLVERLLSVIDTLEQDEQDPDQLANFFQLDHLATRMRRNNESLLVLSGRPVPRRIDRLVPASEVVDGAKSEVEQYQRIDVAHAPEVFVQGRVASDLMHLLAELLENATYFSSREKKVTVRILVSRHKDLLIKITDEGVGMSEKDIRLANQRLANPPDLDVMVTRRMGLYVVARLAKKHGIAVKLRENEDIDGGLAAQITVPETLISVSPAPTTRSANTLTSPAATSQTREHTAPSADSSLRALSVRPRAEDRRTSTASTTASTAAWTAGPTTAPTTAAVAEDGAAWTAHMLDSSTQAGAGTPHTQNVRTYGLTGGTPVPEANDERGVASFSSAGTVSTSDYLRTGTAETVNSIDDGHDDKPTERLPIYEAVLSQWFTTPGESGSDPSTLTVNAVRRPSPTERHDGSHHDAHTVGNGAGTGSWESTGDAGWRAAQTVLTGGIETTTASGLPKRVPQSRLMPGSAAPRRDRDEAHGQPDRTPVAGLVAVQVPRRSADAARERMSKFQQGLRRGRHGPTSPPDHTNNTGDDHRDQRQGEHS